MSVELTKARLSDIDNMQKLVIPEVEAGVILARSSDEIATNIRSYILAKEGDEIVGFCALHIHTPSLAEIRSLVVKEGKRGMGIGQSLIARAIEEAQMLGLQKVLSLTYKQSFFEKLGFVEIPKESLPEHKIWADCIKCKHFPVCNEVSLIKTL
ncbi:MAG: GNAT family N-acetyltransferase [Sulfurimonas sp. RIFCSPHIGHO2_12_FULL_36_9]|uniref:N-acetyltransferase n=1 Tax=Sulfurimonas sp. RIFCSPLOWO2_12_36_12 TaxID=1802253 RepID=UPI0008C943E7|nr:N-acetyltransferase [Sulfurimonas sp. RIFCSPLOWO2_12_36_12]OHD97922.1 MAG: GNAT family N-acetyltransferase [Sulfurimonas sp. RIFCSPHIGHO2_12_FULL_36_9]OHE00842.1 MAG: GNAT family N-acetyltransferase [Sulfurimonas sp. RIFCSPLOWO2_02_FULL_36_28]OHE01840.1 MAG: GNAT family N-acetyltransferase [Sulfurimonas sp. RIFCSPLOWO2_12_36_12]OHE07825.1 MAG: GNAT family N-acetyltransferase [Sulfurimonas sp. RIFCSPLOWO2_12_FULL_36_74]